MQGIEPQFSKDSYIYNDQTNERLVIIDTRYNKDKSCIEYKIQKTRHLFNMFWLGEPVVLRNINDGRWKQKKE